jgi:IS5 family transposase
MRKRTWQEYNRDLVKRGSLTFFIDQECLKPPCKNRAKLGRPKLFTPPLIQLLLLLKIQYRMTYRSLEGFAKSILPLLKQDVVLPTYSLICKRASEVEAILPKLSNRRSQIIMLDATGIKVSGEGEWKVKIHGKTKRRKWIKVHIAVDAKTQEILQLEITDGHTADCSIGPKLISKCPAAAKLYLADGGYDTRGCRRAINEKGARALIPPRRNAKWDPKQKARNRSVSERKGLGLDEVGISLWGKLTGYSRRALVETSFSRMKGLYGASFYSRKLNTQRVEGHLKCLMMNRMIGKTG